MSTTTKTRPAVKRTRPRGYIENYRPQAKTWALLADVGKVLQEYGDYLPLTVRQVFYRLVGRYLYPKTERFYHRVCEHVANARRGRVIPFWAIRDDDMSVIRQDHFEDEDAFYRNVRERGDEYKRDKLARQPYHIEVWCEAAGMVPQLAQVTKRFSVPVYSCSGFDSLTAKKDLADRICKGSKPAIILHLGDYDPSGVSISNAIAEDVLGFVLKDRPHGLVDVEFYRVALTEAQVLAYDLPTTPPKSTDSRTKAWGEDRGTCQFEALPPDLVARTLAAAIESVFDMDILKEDEKMEELEHRRIALALPSPNGGAP